ncbi:MAG TPA: hypothetical protein VFA07_08875 [Chthonomonadaceae bacterium]|nr:hypothetical protein [Chthonomonadaceae bacterium]
MNPSSDTLETGLQSAHLLMMRGRYYEARLLLEELATRFPGNVDVARLLLEIAEHLAPPPPRRTMDFSFLNRDLDRRDINALRVVLIGLFFLGETLYVGIPAVRAAIANG